MPLVEVTVENRKVGVDVLDGGIIPDDVSLSITYDNQGRFSTLTSPRGTKTATYNLDGTLASIVGTGAYKSKTFTYFGGKLVGVSVT